MGVANLPHLAAGLQRHGLAPETPLAILEKGFSAAQRAIATTLGGVVRILAETKPVSPAVIVVGEVVGVAGDLDWAIGTGVGAGIPGSWQDESPSGLAAPAAGRIPVSTS